MFGEVMTRCGQVVFFFFQAEDGIRDYKVTGVQTCALPISRDREDSALVAFLPSVSAFQPRRQRVRRLARRLAPPSSTPPTRAPARAARNAEIGRASCRERV